MGSGRAPPVPLEVAAAIQLFLVHPVQEPVQELRVAVPGDPPSLPAAGRGQPKVAVQHVAAPVPLRRRVPFARAVGQGELASLGLRRTFLASVPSTRRGLVFGSGQRRDRLPGERIEGLRFASGPDANPPPVLGPAHARRALGRAQRPQGVLDRQRGRAFGGRGLLGCGYSTHESTARQEGQGEVRDLHGIDRCAGLRVGRFAVRRSLVVASAPRERSPPLPTYEIAP